MNKGKAAEVEEYSTNSSIPRDVELTLHCRGGGVHGGDRSLAMLQVHHRHHKHTHWHTVSPRTPRTTLSTLTASALYACVVVQGNLCSVLMAVRRRFHEISNWGGSGRPMGGEGSAAPANQLLAVSRRARDRSVLFTWSPADRDVTAAVTSAASPLLIRHLTSVQPCPCRCLCCWQRNQAEAQICSATCVSTLSERFHCSETVLKCQIF